MAVFVRDRDVEFVTFGVDTGIGVVGVEGGFVGPNPTLAWESLDVPYLVAGSHPSEECRALAWATPAVNVWRLLANEGGLLEWNNRDDRDGERITASAEVVRRWLLLHDEGMFERAQANPLPSPTDGHFLETVESAIEWALENVGDAEQDYPPGKSTFSRVLRDKKEEEVAEYVDQFHEAMRSDRVTIWRRLEIPADQDPMDAIDWENLGIYWSFRESGAGVYAGHLAGPTDEVTIVATVMPADIDWEHGFTSFWYYGTEQFECALKPGAEIRVLRVEDTQQSLEARANPIKVRKKLHVKVCPKAPPKVKIRVKRRPLVRVLPAIEPTRLPADGLTPEQVELMDRLRERARRRAPQPNPRRNMAISLAQTLSQELICSLCERPMSNHASSCPERLAESIQASRLLWRCPRCLEDVERNMDDFLECRGCATVYSTSGVGPATDALMPVSPGTDLEPVVALEWKGRGQFDYDKKMAEVAAMRRRVEAGRRRAPSQEALERRWRAAQERERREVERAEEERELVGEVTKDCSACDRVRRSGVTACRRHAREIQDRKSGWNPRSRS